MRILYLTDTYPPQVNGVSVVTQLTVAGLRARGHELGVIAPRYPTGRSVFPGTELDLLLSIPSCSVPAYPEIRLAAPTYFRIAAAARRFQPDLVHCATEGVIGRLGQIVARQLGVPLVTSYHTNFGWYMKVYGASWAARPTSAYLRRFHRRADLTLTPSRSAAYELARLGVERTVVWGAGVDADLYHPAKRRPDVRARLQVADRFVFLHVGRLAPEKNVEVVLEAFAHCRRMTGDRVALVVAGDGPSRLALERDAPPDVRFVGYLDRAAGLPELYASADGFVIGSETETLGLVVLEAMASGLPVVAAPMAGVAEYLKHGVNGLGTNPGDPHAMARAMTQLVTELRLRSTLAEGARRTGESLSWEREFDRIDAIYRDLCAPAQVLTHPIPSLVGSN